MVSQVRTVVVAAALALSTACSSEATTNQEPTTSTTPDTSTTKAPRQDATLSRYVGYESKEYSDESRWLCWPGIDGPCTGDLSVTTVNPNGISESTLQPATDPEFDCFYVYPTISRDSGAVSDWDASDEEEGYAARYQVAPLSTHCRVFAPIYRQHTLESLVSRFSASGEPIASDHDPLVDVLDAWSTYMATENNGRGVVLVGHSQGSALLTELIATEIEPHPEVLDVLIAAYLPGTSVQVPDGELLGGSFTSTPLCTTKTDTGCVVTWSTYRDEIPPAPNAIFGRDDVGDGTVAACNLPSSLDGSAAPTRPLFPSQRSASVLASLLPPGDETDSWFGDVPIETTYAALPDFLTAQCAQTDTHRYAALSVNADPTDQRADDISGDLSEAWGLHLVDVSVVLGDMVELVSEQYRSWAAR